MNLKERKAKADKDKYRNSQKSYSYEALPY